jgi:hypothetical protein
MVDESKHVLLIKYTETLSMSISLQPEQRKEFKQCDEELFSCLWQNVKFDHRRAQEETSCAV